jgi:hypothetical protein
LCTDVFVTPWYHDNVVLTPGDYGGRMSNRLKSDELYVIIPVQYVDNLIGILDTAPDIAGIYEATRPPESDYWRKKAAREQRAAQREGARRHNLRTSMEWDDDALDFVARAPRFVRRFAVGRVEDFALDSGYRRVTLAVVEEQMEQAGTRDFMGGVGSDAPAGDEHAKRGRKSGLLRRLLGR